MLTGLALIFLCGLFLAAVFRKAKLPPLLGMLITGILLGPNVLNLLGDSILSVSADLRQLALIIILSRAGLNLEVQDLKKVGRPALLQAAIGPLPLAMGLSCGNIALTVAVLAILITAPLGAFLIDLTSGRLLEKESVFEDDSDHQTEKSIPENGIRPDSSFTKGSD